MKPNWKIVNVLLTGCREHRHEAAAHILVHHRLEAHLGAGVQISALKGEANTYLGDPNHATLRLRLVNVHAAVEAAAVEARGRVRLDEAR